MSSIYKKLRENDCYLDSEEGEDASAGTKATNSKKRKAGEGGDERRFKKVARGKQGTKLATDIKAEDVDEDGEE